MFSRITRPFSFAVLVIASLCAATRATTIVAMSDEDLAVSSRAIVEGRVVGTEARLDADRGAVFTFVTLDVESVYKGDLAPGTVVLKQLGGRDADATTVVFGAPTFAAGDRVLLFLTADGDGSARVAHLCLGDYRILDDGRGGRIVAHPHTDADVLAKAGSGPVTDAQERGAFLERLGRTLRERAAQSSVYEHAGAPLRAVPAGFAPSADKGRSSSNFTTLPPGVRWFQPDTNEKIFYRVNKRGAPTPSGGIDEAKAAFGAWTSVDRSNLQISFGGESSKCGLHADGENVVSFGDCDHQLDDPVNCSGIVAIGGISSAGGAVITLNGKQYQRINEGDITVNNGFECLLSNPASLGEVLTHELGHTLGFGHSSEKVGEPDPVLRDATMYFVSHNDGRGAVLRQDDIAAVRFLYPGTRAATPLAIVTDAVPDARLGQAYSFQFRATGAAPFTWSLSSGRLPTGITLSSDGVMAGTVATGTSASFEITLRDASGGAKTRPLVLRATATPAPFISHASFDPDKSKLFVTGLYLDATATLTINSRTVSAARAVRFKAVKSKLSVAGTADQLGIRFSSANSVVVMIGGRISNTSTF